MRITTAVLLGAGILAGSVTAYTLSSSSDRRSFLTKSAATGASALVLNPKIGYADDFITTETGMKYKVLVEGNGAVPLQGQTVKAHYTGWLDGFDSDKKFDSSRDRGRPFTFKVATGQVIRGWDEAFGTMKVGERRQIILPPRLAYGDRGAGGISKYEVLRLLRLACVTWN
jgi:FKBP-type peptidyl-prolyl cis-trans isomerase